MNLRELKELFRLVEKTDFTELEVVQGDLRVRIERGKKESIRTVETVAPVPVVASEKGAEKISSSKPEPSQEEAAASDKDAFITSPFVGTFYRSPSPDAETYVEVGDKVRSGQAVCIVEAMKLMNEIESDFEGTIVEIYPENGRPVEFGEKLFRIEIS